MKIIGALSTKVCLDCPMVKQWLGAVLSDGNAECVEDCLFDSNAF